jgi:type IV secretion system protein VirB1
MGMVAGLGKAVDVATFALLARTCAPSVDSRTTHAIVSVESSFNPYAIGVVGDELVRQPRNEAEARATARALHVAGINFSAGLGQINVKEWPRLHLDEHTVFESCANLRAMQTILLECFVSAGVREPDSQRALRQALSCYYSGTFSIGFRDGYVARVERAATAQAAGRASRTTCHRQGC